MSVNTLETPAVPPTWQQEDEIDLRQYLDVVIRWWREIALIAAGVAVLAGLAILTQRMLAAPSYVAEASVAISRTVSDVSFDERFLTTTDEVGSDINSISARRSALLGLVATGSIAADVIAELGDLLSEEERDPAYLLQQIEATPGPTTGPRNESDLIQISASADAPEKAAAIANAWAAAYVRQINTVYGQVPNEVLDSIQAELAIAQQTYLDSQARVEAFLAESRLKDLTNLSTVLQQRIDQEVALIQSYLGEWQRTGEQLNAAQALRTQLQQGGESAAQSAMPALQTLKITMYGKPSGNLVYELRDMPGVTQEAMLADVAGIITSLEERLAALDREIARRSDGLRPTAATADASSIVSPLYDEIRRVQAEIEAETARKTQFEQQRNLNWEAYKALSNKVAELNLTRAASSSEVRFAAPAVPPIEPIKGLSLVIGVGVAGIFGLFLALVIAFLSEYLGRKPFLSARGAR